MTIKIRNSLLLSLPLITVSFLYSFVPQMVYAQNGSLRTTEHTVESFNKKINTLFKNAGKLREEGKLFEASQLYESILQADIFNTKAKNELNQTLHIYLLQIDQHYLSGDMARARKMVEILIAKYPQHKITQLAVHSYNRNIAKSDGDYRSPTSLHLVKRTNNLIHDKKTGLTWTINPSSIDYSATQQWLKSLQATNSNWRLPTPEEVAGLIISTPWGKRLDYIFDKNNFFIWAEPDQENEQRSSYIMSYRIDNGSIIMSSSGSGSSTLALAVKDQSNTQLTAQSNKGQKAAITSVGQLYNANITLDWHPGPMKLMNWGEVTNWINELRRQDKSYRLATQEELLHLFAHPEKFPPGIEQEYKQYTDATIWTGETTTIHGAYLFSGPNKGIIWRYQAAAMGYPLAVRGELPPAIQNKQQQFSISETGIITDFHGKKQWITGPNYSTTIKDAKRWLSNLSYSLGAGWRLPTISELKELQLERNGKPCVHGFIEHPDDFFEPYPVFEARGDYIWTEKISAMQNFDPKLTKDQLPHYPQTENAEDHMGNLRVFAVRNLSEDTKHTLESFSAVRFLLDDQFTLFDLMTGKQWVKGPDRDTNWFDAYQWVRQLQLTQDNDWRLPTLEELHVLINHGESAVPLLINEPADDRIYYWSGDEKLDDPQWTYSYSAENGTSHAQLDSTANRRGLAVKGQSMGSIHLSNSQTQYVSPKHKSLKNSIGMEFSYIHPDTFVMGDDKSFSMDPTTSAGEDHQVTLTHPYYLQQTEVTIDQFLHYLNETSSEIGIDFTDSNCPIEKYAQDYRMKLGSGITWVDANQPMVCVNWYGATAFANWLSHKEKRKYRLPTEAEWEFAGRAGSKEQFHFGKDYSQGINFGWIWSNSTGMTHPVGRKQPNDWSIYDIHGNAAEWMLDGKRGYTEESITDPTGPMDNAYKSVRGGNFSNNSGETSFKVRPMEVPAEATDHKIGFRLLLEPQ